MTERRISVLQLGKYYSPVKGGIETYLYNLCTNLDEDIESRILVSNLSMKTEIDRVEGTEVIRMAKLDQLFSTSLNPSLPLWMRREKADILHFHLPNPMAVMSYLLTRPPGKVVVSYHSDILKQKFAFTFYRKFLVKFLSLADAIIVATPRHIDHSPILPAFRDKCHVIHYGIDHRLFDTNELVAARASEIRAKYGPRPLVLFVGRLVYYKGIQHLLKAVKGLDVNLLIVGNGPYYSTLKMQSMDEPNIHLLGEVSETMITAYYHASDMFVLPSVSRAEAFGLVQLEAFSAGLPVICTDLTTGVPYVNVHGKTGLIVPVGDETALASAIETLAADPEMRKAMGREALNRVRQEFDLKSMASKTCALYRKLLEN
ncbi:MAG: glycosyltransferase [Candidatus Wallbacteria bacterium HGW-Wallbacteria-1]|jgi:rhamnosyl/mannosyltransferase|uniref:Glycosyltransferase n=1 Tax=Candidatus Wallbacteria bacterium HGW-Wallbacteria-1 TaxID=2013854 RepID=A0A2N1PPN4_9BACT|nr:MAG: glycosyltransferase [Candidatus Wallbacteria bacterium HGW-Wallbacteria-1]